MTAKQDGMYYLNNDGDRWIIIEDGRNARRVFRTKSGKWIVRAVKYFSQAGNFTLCNIWYKGERIDVSALTILEA